jgi:hypothetical protein
MMEVAVIYKDFRGSHEDFENFFEDDGCPASCRAIIVV